MLKFFIFILIILTRKRFNIVFLPPLFNLFTCFFAPFVSFMTQKLAILRFEAVQKIAIPLWAIFFGILAIKYHCNMSANMYLVKICVFDKLSYHTWVKCFVWISEFIEVLILVKTTVSNCTLHWLDFRFIKYW